MNVLVEQNPDDPTPPILFEPDPTHRRLFGHIERRAQQGVLVSTIDGIRAGSLLAASGGFLVVRALDLLDDPTVFSRLKRALKTLAQPFDEPIRLSDVFASTLSPREVPLTTRVVLVGPEEVYSMLRSDPDFTALFRVKVEVDVMVDRTEQHLAQLDGFLMALGRERGWLPFDPGARARLLSVATEIAGDREQVSLMLPPLEETAAFATHMCRERGGETVSVEDIDSAWQERLERVTAAAKHLRNPILRGEIFIDTQGSRIGVVNGLAVIPTHDVDLGQPMRITAIVSPGNEGVIDVERESHLGGSIHTKGVVILRGLLGRLFGQERPFSLRAQIAFEQSYGEIDGDSASSAEFFAIISALAEVGIDQGISVTGSVNQLGEMQPIGGVVAKIESFYDLCAARGLTGMQGVILPRANARHVMLRDDIVKAVAEKKFHIHAIHTVAEGIEILTGIPAGDRDDAGRFPASSIYGRVERRLIELAERLRNDGTPEPRDSMHIEGEIELTRADLGKRSPELFVPAATIPFSRLERLAMRFSLLRITSLSVSMVVLASGCADSSRPTTPPAPPMSQTPGAALPPGWVWPFNPANIAQVFSNNPAIRQGVLRPVDAARVAALQSSGTLGACAPVQVAPNVWITPLCGNRFIPSVPFGSPTSVVAPVSPASPSLSTRAFETPAGNLPIAVDLRASGLDGPVKNQQMTGVCWSFAVSTLMENALRRSRRGEVMAPLHIVASGIWDEIFTKGRSDRDLTLENSWPYDPVKACELNENDEGCEQAYHVKSGSWRADPNLSREVEIANQHGVFRISKMQSLSVKPANTDQLASILASGQAIYAGFDFNRDAWSYRNLQGGVIPDYPVADGGAGHGVALVGYRATPTGRQFLIHNSWGPDWGQQGYAWISDAMIRQHVHRAFTLEVVGPSGQNLPTPGPIPAPIPSGPSTGQFPFPFPFPFPGGAPTPTPAPSASGCPSGQARDMVFGFCAPTCGDGSPRVASLCSSGAGAPSPTTPPSPVPLPFPWPTAAPTPTPPAQAACATGQVRDWISGQCVAQCPSGLPPANGVCF
ncbi:MAG: AAA family ATPase [Polyangiaceae bacterium]